MIRFAICDDDEILCEELKNEILKFIVLGEDDRIDLFHSGAELIEACSLTHYYAIFLDIHMNEVDGFDVARQIENENYDTFIIFITSDDALVYKSFQFSPFYFLKKDDYKAILPRVLDKLENEFQQNIYLNIESASEIEKLVLSEIYYIESDRHHIIIHTKKYSYSTRRKISDIERELSSYDFVRIQKGYIVNLRYILRVNMATEEVKLIDNIVLKMSRRNKGNIERIFRMYKRRTNVI